jgi:hypothetical protein
MCCLQPGLMDSADSCRASWRTRTILAWPDGGVGSRGRAVPPGVVTLPPGDRRRGDCRGDASGEDAIKIRILAVINKICFCSRCYLLRQTAIFAPQNLRKLKIWVEKKKITAVLSRANKKSTRVDLYPVITGMTPTDTIWNDSTFDGWTHTTFIHDTSLSRLVSLFIPCSFPTPLITTANCSPPRSRQVYAPPPSSWSTEAEGHPFLLKCILADPTVR